MEEKIIKEQNIVIQNREKTVELVIMQTSLGMLTIKGQELKMNKLNLDNSELIIEGKTCAIAYSDAVDGNKKQGFMSKLFK